MNATIAANELTKMRRLRVIPIAALLFLGVIGMTAFYALGSSIFSHLDDPDGYAWKALLAGVGLATVLITPVLVAVLSSRQVDIEHRGNGWLLSATSGVTPGRLCRAKFLVLSAIITATTVLQSLGLVGFGFLIGITSPFPAGHWLGYTTCAIVVNLVVLGFHVLLSARVENQLVCLGFGMLGVFLGIFGQVFPDWLCHLSPWSYYPLATPADFVGTELVYLDLPYPSIAALALVGSGVFLLVTGRFDRKEA